MQDPAARTGPEGVEGGMAAVLDGFRAKFAAKRFKARRDEPDILMEVFGITPEVKRKNPQYWSRELGSCWEGLIVAACQRMGVPHRVPEKGCNVTPCDLVIRNIAIEIKYRVGSGDAPTLRNLKSNGQVLNAAGYETILLLLRDDSLPGALQRARTGGWKTLEACEAFAFIQDQVGVDLKAYLEGEALRRQDS